MNGTDAGSADGKSNSASSFFASDGTACAGSIKPTLALSVKATGSAVLTRLESSGSEQSAAALSSSTMIDVGELCGACNVPLKPSSAARKPTGGLSAALKARASQDLPREASGILNLPGCLGSEPARTTQPAPADSAAGCGPQRTPILSATVVPPGAPAGSTHPSGPTTANNHPSPSCKPVAAGTGAAADVDDGGDGVSTVRGSPSDAAWDWMPCFSPSLVDRLWTGRSSPGSSSSPPSRSSRHPGLPTGLGLPIREGSRARKRSQQGRAHTTQLRRRSATSAAAQEKDNSGHLPFLPEADTELEGSGAARASGGGAGGPVAGAHVVPPAPHVPCMALVAAAAAAAPAPRALGALCSRCAAAGGTAGRCAAATTPGGAVNSSTTQPPAAPAKAAADCKAAAAAAAAAARHHPAEPPPPPLPPAVAAKAALKQCMDLEPGMPSLGVGAVDRGCSGGSATALLHTAVAATAPAAGTPGRASDAAALAALALQAFAEPRGHIHNGPRMPLYGSPTTQHGAASGQQQQQQQLRGHALAGGLRGGRDCSGLAAAVAAAALGGSGVAACLLATPWTDASGSARDSAADPWVEREADPTPDSPLSQASTIWENPHAPGSYAVRDVHRPKWLGGRRNGGGGGTGDAAGGGGGSGGSGGSSSGSVGLWDAPPDGRTRWWDKTGRFRETDNTRMREELFPYEQQGGGGRRRGGWRWWRWW